MTDLCALDQHCDVVNERESESFICIDIFKRSDLSSSHLIANHKSERQAEEL